MAQTKASKTFTDEEKAAMRERAREAKAATDRASGERDVLDKIAEMQLSDRQMAERIHAIVAEVAPELSPRTYYGMPAYAKDGSVVCYFKPAQKFKMRYAEFGFNDKAALDDGDMWPVTYAVRKLRGADEARIAELVKRAAS
jgi:uncharacterized protein YdhG (YjbR/CyaY superfamily)